MEDVLLTKQHGSLSSPVPDHTDSGLACESIRSTERDRPGEVTNALVCFVRYLLIHSFLHLLPFHLQVGDLQGEKVPSDPQPGLCP